MGLSIRHPKGKLSRRWYWDCQINDRSVSVGLCKMQGRPPREWSLAVPDWSVAHAGDRAFEESRARAVEMAPAAIARKRELLNKTPRAIMEQALEDAKAKARVIPMSDGKRRKVLRMLDLYAEGKTYAEVSADVGCPKSLVSLYLNEIQDLMLPVYTFRRLRRERPNPQLPARRT